MPGFSYKGDIMREGIAISTKNEKERLYYGSLLGAFIEADRAMSEYKALVDIKRYHGNISTKEASERAKEMKQPLLLMDSCRKKYLMALPGRMGLHILHRAGTSFYVMLNLENTVNRI